MKNTSENENQAKERSLKRIGAWFRAHKQAIWKGAKTIILCVIVAVPVVYMTYYLIGCCPVVPKDTTVRFTVYDYGAQEWVTNETAQGIEYAVRDWSWTLARAGNLSEVPFVNNQFELDASEFNGATVVVFLHREGHYPGFEYCQSSTSYSSPWFNEARRIDLRARANVTCVAWNDTGAVEWANNTVSAFTLTLALNTSAWNATYLLDPIVKLAFDHPVAVCRVEGVYPCHPETWDAGVAIRVFFLNSFSGATSVSFMLNETATLLNATLQDRGDYKWTHGW